MQNQLFSCDCGNLKIAGQKLPRSVYPNISPSDRERLRNIQSISYVKQQGIEIRDTRQVHVRLLSPTCADMHCICGALFRFFIGRGFSYFGRICNSDQGNQQVPNPSDTYPQSLLYTGNNLPKILMPLISKRPNQGQINKIDRHSLNPFNEIVNNIDTDFDLMFSNRLEPVVGSYKKSTILPNDGLIGAIRLSDIQSKSYVI